MDILKIYEYKFLQSVFNFLQIRIHWRAIKSRRLESHQWPLGAKCLYLQSEDVQGKQYQISKNGQTFTYMTGLNIVIFWYRLQ